MKTCSILSLLTMLLLIIVLSASANATTLSANLSVDDAFSLYLSTDKNMLGTFIGSGDTWTATYSYNGIPLTPRVKNYIQVVGTDQYQFIAAFMGDFTLSDTAFAFSNGTQFLETNTSSGWEVYDTVGGNPLVLTLADYYGSALNGSWPWGFRTEISANAYWIWTNHGMDLTSRYFVAEVDLTDPVTITEANLVRNTVTVQLRGASGTWGVLKVTANGMTNNYAAITPTNPVGPGIYTVSFDRLNMPIDTYKSITAEWDIGSPPATTTYSMQTGWWIVKGVIRHSQYNTPLESKCSGSPQQAWVFDSNCNFTKVPHGLNSNFMNQVVINGTGYSTNNGIIKYCPSTWTACCAAQRPKGATDSNAFLEVSIVTGSCNTKLIAGTSVATYPNPHGNTNLTDFLCRDTALLVTSSDTDQAVKTTQDWCKACSGDFRGTQGHIDDYSPSQACSGSLVGDYGNFWTANTKGENR